MYVTRHGNSCNNIIEDTISGLFTRDDKKNYLNKKSDPSLSVSGIATMLNLYPPHINDHLNEPVYVSSCVRTWMTAILLYAKRNVKIPLILMVSPYLKEEKHDRGNMPETRVIQRAKMDNFYCFLKRLSEYSTSESTVLAERAQLVLQKHVRIIVFSDLSFIDYIFNFDLTI